MTISLDNFIGTNKNQGNDDKEDDGFFVGDFGYLCIHEEEVDKLIFGPEGYDDVRIFLLVDVLVLVLSDHRFI